MLDSPMHMQQISIQAAEHHGTLKQGHKHRSDLICRSESPCVTIRQIVATRSSSIVCAARVCSGSLASSTLIAVGTRRRPGGAPQPFEEGDDGMVFSVERLACASGDRFIRVIKSLQASCSLLAQWL